MRPHEGSVLIALGEGDEFPPPLRFEVETRWFGTVAVQLAWPPSKRDPCATAASTSPAAMPWWKTP